MRGGGIPRKKITKNLKFGWVIAVFVCLTKIQRIFENIFFQTWNRWCWVLLDFGCLVCGIIHKVLVVKDFEIKTECHWGSGGVTYFLTGKNGGSCKKFQIFSSLLLMHWIEITDYSSKHLLLPTYSNFRKMWSSCVFASPRQE